MSLQSVREFFAAHAPEIEITEHPTSTASVIEAANTIGVEPGQIAKTLAVKIKDRIVIVVTRGDARLDNKKLKSAFGGRPSMVPAPEVAELTGHPVGGVCPFGLARDLEVFCDISLKDYATVHPAAGATNASVCIAPEYMRSIVNANWIDLCQGPQNQNDNEIK